MSLEDMHKKAVRKIKKRDAALAKEGTTAGQEQLKKAEEANSNVSRAQMEPVPEGRVRHDGGFGTKEDIEGIPCRKGCGVRITGGLADIKKHYDEFHPDAE